MKTMWAARVFRKIFVALGFVSILGMAFVVYSADDDILFFIPAVVRGQATVNPVGTWTGSGYRIIPQSGCLSKIENATMIVAATEIQNLYTVNVQYSSTAVDFKGQCSDSRSTTEYAMLHNNMLDSVEMGKYLTQTGEVGYVSTTDNHVAFSGNSAELTRKEYLMTPSNGWTQGHVITISFTRQ
jgi:hypothetical protein